MDDQTSDWPTILLYKVLVAGKPIHGGVGRYPPVGEWTDPVDPKCCVQGYHLTSDPLLWWRPRAQLFLMEGRGPLDGKGDNKAAFRQVRLVAEVTREWPLLVMFPRIRAFLAATSRSFDPKADITWTNLTLANLAGAYLAGAYRPTGPPAGWAVDANGRLKRA